MRRDPEKAGGALWLDAVLYDDGHMAMNTLIDCADSVVTDDQPKESHGHTGTIQGR